MTVSPDKPLSRRQLRETPRAEQQVDEESTEAVPSEVDAAPSAFRTRDYRPEGRRSSFAPSFTSANLGEWTPATPAVPSDAVSDGKIESDHATEPEAESAQASPVSPAADDRDGWNRPVRSDLDAPERTMTRRELRILRARAEAAGQPAPDVVFLPNGETTVTGAIDILDSPEPARAESVEADDRPVESTHPDGVVVAALSPEADAAGVITETLDPSANEDRIDDAIVIEDDRSAVGTADVVDIDTDGSASGADDTDSAPQVDAAGVITEQPVEEDSASGSTDPNVVIPALIEPLTGESPRFQTDAGAPAEIVVDAEQPASDGTPAPGTLRPFDALFLPPSAVGGAESALDTSSAQPTNDTDGLRGDILAAPDGPAKPFGHWSTQNDDDGPHTDGTLSRDVGVTTGALTTHALVLPSIPDSGEPLLSPLTSTGEVMVTGTIDLPRSFGSTGAHPALFDHPDVDAIIDDSDRDESDAGIAPVRASRAVSSSTTTRSMIGTETEKKSRLLPVLGIVIGGVIVVAIATVVIVMFATNQF